jgi:phage/plasmid-like protein (TIGR03299 family)
MPANVETMFYVRETPWHGLGTRVEEALNSEEALVASGLDWEVEQVPISVKGIIQHDTLANVRSTDNKMLGLVTDRYKVVQNKDAFAFTDELLGMDVRYETAGSLANGKRIWLLARMPDMNILDDKVCPYLVFYNSFDGKGSVRGAITPVRVVCQNTLNLALKGAVRQWSMKHTGNIEYKMEEARQTLNLSMQYMNALQAEAEVLVKKTMQEGEVKDFVEMLFPMPNVQDSSNVRIRNVQDDRSAFIKCYNMPDIEKYRGTQFAVINAVSDFVTHIAPHRMSKTYNENLFMKVVDGNTLIDDAYAMLKVA